MHGPPEPPPPSAGRRPEGARVADPPPVVNVLVLTGSLNVGGAETALLNLVRVLGRPETREAERVNVHLCAFGNRSVFGETTLLERAKALPVPLKLIRSRRFYDVASWREIRRYVAEHDIHLIHSFLASADIVANLIGRLDRIPVVTSLRNVPDGYLRSRTDAALLMRFLVIPGATRLVALSESIRRTWIDRFDIRQERIVTIPNAASIERFLDIPAERPAVAGRPLTVTTVGRLAPQKAHDDFIRAAALVLKRLPGTRFRIVGRGELEQDLRSLAADLGVGDAIEFTGVRDDVERIHADTHVFVLSSRWEGMSVAAIEAMAAALPVVLTDVGANPDLIEHGVHGLLVPPARPESLADAVVALLDSPQKRLAMGRGARERAAARFAGDSNCRSYVDLYREALGRGPA